MIPIGAVFFYSPAGFVIGARGIVSRNLAMDLQAPPVLRVGVTGHRADKLREESAALISPLVVKTLQRLREVVERTQGARLQVVSPLAEGADRLVAKL